MPNTRGATGSTNPPVASPLEKSGLRFMTKPIIIYSFCVYLPMSAAVRPEFFTKLNTTAEGHINNTLNVAPREHHVYILVHILSYNKYIYI